MLTMTPLILIMDFTKTQKSRYVENETLFFLQIKKIINYTLRATIIYHYFFSVLPENIRKPELF